MKKISRRSVMAICFDTRKRVLLLATLFSMVVNYSLGQVDNSAHTPVESNEFESLVGKTDVELTFTNDSVYPWLLGDAGKITNGNGGVANSSSALSMTYTSDYPTTLNFSYDVTGYDRDKRLQVIIDGEQVVNAYNETGINKTYHFPKGKHTVTFHDTTYNTTSIRVV